MVKNLWEPDLVKHKYNCNQVLKIKNLSVQKVLNNKNITQNVNYAAHLVFRANEFRNKRRKLALKAKAQNKEQKIKQIFFGLRKGYNKEQLAVLIQCSVRYVNKLLKIIKERNENNYLVNKKNELDFYITSYLNTIEKIKICEYDSLPGYQLGYFKKVKKILKQTGTSIQSLMLLYFI